MTSRAWKIYALNDPRTGEARYVGKTWARKKGAVVKSHV